MIYTNGLTIEPRNGLIFLCENGEPVAVQLVSKNKSQWFRSSGLLNSVSEKIDAIEPFSRSEMAREMVRDLFFNPA